MKTIKFIFSLLVSLILVMPSLAADESVGIVYAKDIVAQPGTEVELPIVLKNTIPLKSVQFKVLLPEGLNFTKNGIKYQYFIDHSDLNSDWTITANINGDETSREALIMVFNMNDAISTLSEGETTLLTLLVKVDKGADLTDKQIAIYEETIVGEDDTEYTPLGKQEKLMSNISIGTKNYPEENSLQIMPFAYNGDVEMDYILTNNSKLTAIDFYVKMLPVIITNELYYNELSLKKTQFSFSDELDGETVHINICRKGSNTIAAGENSIAAFGLAEDEDAVVSAGIYQLQLLHIRLTDTNGNIIEVAPYTADIYVGATTPVAAPDENGAVAFHGNYADETAQALMTEALKSDDITTIDLSEVTAATEIVPQNKNTIIRCSKDLGLDQPNVVIGDECANLVLTDGFAFKNTETFTANAASYSRTMADHSWGTLCLPFAASRTNANVYTLNSVTTGTDGEMKFTQTASAAVVANTPCVIKKDADEVTFTASSVEVPATPADCNVATDVDGWTLLGTTTDLNVADLSKAYFINGDHFWKAGSSLHVAPFRAYFEGASSAAKFRITEETNGIETIENEAKAGVIYDLQGLAVKAAQAGQIYVQGAKKFVVK